MTESIDDAGILAPVSEESPCGPDLEAEGDPEFMNFMAMTEGQLPASFFAFDRKSIDFAAVLEDGNKLLTRSHDIRLIVLLAKLAILDRNVDGFAHWLAVLARLLAEHWEDAPPRGEDGDYAARVSQIGTLNDGPVVILPLQYSTLAETQREGALPFRAQMIAIGETNPRDKENLPTASTIEKILLNADIARLAQTLASLRLIKTSIAQIRTTLIERTSFEEAVSFETLAPLVDRMVAFIQTALAQRDPSVAAPDANVETTPVADGGGPPSRLDFESLADVDAALGSALAYFETTEPSSAAVLLIGQARLLLGKNLYEVMKVLAPNHADAARVFVGAEAAFPVPVSSISTSEPSAAPERRESPPAPSRATALSLVDSVAAHMRKVEPSSPTPFLLDRAKALASRDFVSLLKDLLPEDALSNLKGGGEAG